MDQLILREKDDHRDQVARREKAKADAKWMKQVLDDQIKLEKTERIRAGYALSVSTHLKYATKNQC